MSTQRNILENAYKRRYLNISHDHTVTPEKARMHNKDSPAVIWMYVFVFII